MWWKLNLAVCVVPWRSPQPMIYQISVCLRLVSLSSVSASECVCVFHYLHFHWFSLHIPFLVAVIVPTPQLQLLLLSKPFNPAGEKPLKRPISVVETHIHYLNQIASHTHTQLKVSQCLLLQRQKSKIYVCHILLTLQQLTLRPPCKIVFSTVICRRLPRPCR